MNKKTQGSLVYYTFSHFERTGLVRHAFSTRLGGISEGYLNSLNLGFSRGDKDENVFANYHVFLNALGIDRSNLVFSAQTHTTNVVRVGREHRGNGFLRENVFSDVDGLVTNVPQAALVTFYADCVPIFLLDPVKKAICLAHAGWKGTLHGIARNAVNLLKTEFGANPADLLAGIGPSIGPCCFETDKNVYALFEAEEYAKAHVNKTGEGKAYINLQAINADILKSVGIRSSNLEIAELCTKCNSGIFYSHRAMGEKRGSLAAIMELI